MSEYMTESEARRFALFICLLVMLTQYHSVTLKTALGVVSPY